MSSIFSLDPLIKNSPWSIEAAYVLFPYLVECAKNGKKITYKECLDIVDKKMNNIKGSGSAVKIYKPAYIIKLICDVISENLTIQIPILNFIIVNKATQNPGYGVGSFINLPTKEKEYKNNPALQQQFDKKVQIELNKIFKFKKWDKVLNDFNLHFSPDWEYFQTEEELLTEKSLDDLKNLAEKAGKKKGKHQLSKTYSVTNFPRSPEISAYIKKQANGTCELCQQKAPFIKKNGEPFLECHHIIWLSQQGEDKINNTVALCPNCHRKMHSLKNPSDIKKLKEWVKKREKKRLQ